MDGIGYPIRAVARMTGIGLDTLRAWERRYQAVKPERGERGRLYRDRDIRRLLLLKEVVAMGHAIGQIASLPEGKLEQLLQAVGPRTARNSADVTGGAVPGSLRPLFKAIEKFDAPGLDRELGKLALAHPPRTLVHEVIHPLLRQVGEDWAARACSIAQEHLVSAALRNLVGGILRLYSPSSASPTVVLTTPSGELHEFGILCAALLAAGGGLRTVYLGPNLPAAEIAASARKASATAVILGVLSENAQAEVKSLARTLPPGVELWIGGREGVLPEVKRQPRWLWVPGFPDLEKQLARIGARY